MQVVLKVILACGLLMAANASPMMTFRTMMKNQAEEDFSESYDLVFGAQLNSTNQTASLPQPDFGHCIAAFMDRNDEIMTNFGNTTLGCANITAAAAEEFAQTREAQRLKNRFNLKMKRCARKGDMARTKKCYVDTIVHTLLEAIFAIKQTAFNNTMCIVQSTEEMVQSMGASSEQLVECVNTELKCISSFAIEHILPGILNWPSQHIPYWPWRYTPKHSHIKCPPGWPNWNTTTTTVWPNWNTTQANANASTPLWNTTTAAWPIWNTTQPNLNESTPFWNTTTAAWPIWNTTQPNLNESTPLWNTTTAAWPIWNTTQPNLNESTPLWNASTAATPNWNTTQPNLYASTPIWNTASEEKVPWYKSIWRKFLNIF